MSSTMSPSRGRLGLAALALVLVLTGCHRTDADLEIDLRRGDGGFWLATSGLRRDVTMCTTAWSGAGADADGSVKLMDCPDNEDNPSHQVFERDERDLIGLYMDGDHGVRVFWSVVLPQDCWALEVERPAGERLRVTLPNGQGQLLVAPGCVPPRCRIRRCE